MPAYSTAYPSTLSGTVAGTWSAYNTSGAITMGSAVVVLSDALDTTYIAPTALGPDNNASVYFTMNNLTAASGYAISVIRLVVRGGYSGDYSRAYAVANDGSRVISEANWYGNTVAMAQYSGGWANSPTAGSAWSASELANVSAFFEPTATTSRAAQMYMEAKQVTLPYGTPTVTYSSAMNPRTTWTYGDGDGNAQSSAEVKYFATAVYGSAGFDPDSSTYLFSTVVAGTYLSVAPDGSAVANGEAFKPYVRVYSDKDGVAIRGTWTPSTAVATAVYSGTVVIPPGPTGGAGAPSPSLPSPLTVAGTYLTDYRRNRITISAASGYYYTLYRSSNDVVGSSFQPLSSSTTTIYDYLQTRGGTTTYTANIYTSGTALVQTTTVNVVAATATTWELQSIVSPTSIYDFDVKVTAQDITQYEGTSVVRPLDSSYPIVLAGDINQEDGTLQIITTSAAEYADMTELLNLQSPIVLTSPFLNEDGTNREWLIRITDRSWSGANTVSRPINRISVSYVETDPSGY